MLAHAIVKTARRRPTSENAQRRVISVAPGVPLLTSWIQKVLKIVENSLQNDHKKYESRCCICQKHAPSTDLRKCIETHSFLSLPVLLCSRHGCKIAQNRRKSSMGASDPSKISEIRPKVEKSQKKNNKEIPKHHKQCSNT